MIGIFRRGLAAAMLALMAATPQAASADAAIGKADAATADSAAYDAALARARQDDLTVDFKWLRQQHAARFGSLMPDWPERNGLFDKLDSDAGAALAGAEARLAQDYVSPEAHLLAEIALTKLGRTEDATRHHAFLSAYVQSVTEKKDGRSAETAWNAASVPEEYFVLMLLGYKTKRQALINGKSGIYDAMDVTEEDSGKDATIYFDISSFFGKEFEGLGK